MGVSMSNRSKATKLLTEILRLLDIPMEELDYSRELDLKRTPGRVIKMWCELMSGCHCDPPRITTFPSNHDQILMLRDVAFQSLCSHHFLPFTGVAHIAYVPGKTVIGLSKPARVLDYFATQPQTQERLTRQVTEYLEKKLEPKGVGIVLVAKHGCIGCRGVKKPGASFVTSKLSGCFLTDAAARLELMSLVHGGVEHGA